MSERRRVAVIGAGVVGASVAYHLARAGADVLIVDEGQPGWLTTSTSFAWVNASAKVDRPAYFRLNFAAIAEHDRLSRELPDASWWHPTGHLRWDFADEGELLRAVEWMRTRGYPAEAWEARRARRLLEPHVVFGPPRSPVALFGGEGWVDGPAMARTLVTAAIKEGADALFGSPVVKVKVVDRAVSAVELAGGELHRVRGIVNAAGPRAASVAEMVGRRLPLNCPPGLVVSVRSGGEYVRHVLHAPGIGLRPDGPGRTLLHARALDGELGSGTEPAELAERVLALAARVVPQLARAEVAEVRLGNRPMPADGLPCVGAAGSVEGYYEAVTHSGVTLAPLLGRVLSQEVVSRRVDPLLSSFRPTRFMAGTGFSPTRAPGVR